MPCRAFRLRFSFAYYYALLLPPCRYFYRVDLSFHYFLMPFQVIFIVIIYWLLYLCHYAMIMPPL